MSVEYGKRLERLERSFLAEVRALLAHAHAGGDRVTVALCKRAILGDPVARGACRIAIEESWSALQETPTPHG